MAYRDLREFLTKLEDRGEFVRIPRELESGYEISALAWELADRLGPAVFFTAKGYDIPLVMNVHGTMERNCLALGLEPRKTYKENFLAIRNRMAELLEDKSRWFKPAVCTKGLSQEVVLTGDEVDLFKLPVMKWSPLDGGPYITATNVITKDPINPKFGQNDGMYRVMIHDKRTTAVMSCSTQDIGIHIARGRSKGMKTMPMAVVGGVDPF